MQLKSITAIIVLLLVVASLLVSGCSTNTNNQTPSVTPSTATHDALLERYLAAFKDELYSNKTWTVNAWKLEWTNSTSARLEYTVRDTMNRTGNHVLTLTVFPTSESATQYLNAMNKTAYSLANNQYGSGGVYFNATGHAPQIYNDYQWLEGNPFNISEYRQHDIAQLDNLVIIRTSRNLAS